MRSPAHSVTAARLSALLCTTLLGACSVGPDFLRPALPEAAGFTSERHGPAAFAAAARGVDAQQFLHGADVPGQWWKLFHSPALDALVDEALAANPDVAAAQAALLQANEMASAGQSDLFPTLSANGSHTREEQLGNRTLGVSTASLNVSYALDVFGGARRAAESAEAQADYQRFQLEATYLSLTTNVVNAAVAIASLTGQIQATKDVIRAETDQLGMMEESFKAGAIAQPDLLTQQSTLAQTRALLPPLEKQLAQARNQLMRLLGRFPNQDKGETFSLAALRLPKDLPVSLPSRLVEQRPDVRAAEAQLHEAGADVGVAIANQLPQFTITGDVGSNAASLDKLFTSGTGVWSLAGSAAQTLFDGAALEHRKRAAVAAYDGAKAQYKRTVLSAFQDVADALRALEADADTLDAQILAETAARETFEQSRTQYQLGAITYLTLLNAEQTYQNAMINRIRAQGARYSDTAALFQALGGGWWNRTDVAPESNGSSVRFALPPIHEIKLPGIR
ncbi:efflux transporter outer membrane subunit [Mesorhizobium sp. B2-3-5]|uniref:efflux transporter outer membrane subunit n=1 Tax=Mesorhizobium sp. B2-3-5 TaxID=2589958 RepID=UPI00112DC495|nr:efflux transporter outer membrane subunit [Mesorhizobium sp. B2-3-5]TPM21588.1 efflux transporter outer membrane subunit [Mesorhizobium sp. B2-3-5]